MAYFVWIAGSILLGVWAANWQRSGLGFAALGVLISPVLGALALLAFGKGRAINSATGLPADIGSTTPQATCPHCAELVQAQAKYCKHCHQTIDRTAA